MALPPLLDSYDNVLLDLDGCVWVDDTVTPGACDAVAELCAGGKRLIFLTNNSRRSPEEYVRKLWSLGVQASIEEMVTAGVALQHFLVDRGQGRVYVIGPSAIFRHVADSAQRILNGTDSATTADAVIVAGHDDFNFRELREATQALLAGAELIAVDRDPTFPTRDGAWPGTGAIVAALEYATERAAVVVGKPEPQIFHTALDRLDEGRTLVIGDRLDSDLKGAAAAGLDGAIVLTGVTSRQDAVAAAEPSPVAVADDLHKLVTGRGR